MPNYSYIILYLPTPNYNYILLYLPIPIAISTLCGHENLETIRIARHVGTIFHRSIIQPV